jgi:hypothetical protein
MFKHERSLLIDMALQTLFPHRVRSRQRLTAVDSMTVIALHALFHDRVMRWHGEESANLGMAIETQGRALFDQQALIVRVDQMAVTATVGFLVMIESENGLQVAVT